MKRKVALTNNNATSAPETAASESSKKSRPSHTPFGAADQEPPPKVAPCDEPEKNDADAPGDALRPSRVLDVKMKSVGAPARAAEPLARAAEPVEQADHKPPPTAVASRDKPEKQAVDVDARSTELVGEEKPVGAEDVPEVIIVDEAEAWTRKGFLSKRGVVEATVAEAVATLAKDYGPKKKKNADALEALPALEKKVKDKTITTQDCYGFSDKWGLPRLPDKKNKQPAVFRKNLQAAKDNMEAQGRLDGESAVLETTLHLELEAFDALPDDEKKSVTIRVAKNTYGCT